MIERRDFMAGGTAIALAAWAAPALAGGKPGIEKLLPSQFSVLLKDLEHPEGAATSPDGRLYLSNALGVIGVLEADGALRQIGKPLAPTGVAVDARGRVLVANMGLLTKQPGPLQRVDIQSGKVETLVDALEGRQLAASNCPAAARDGYVYCSHSSWGPVANIGTTDPAGFIYMVRPDGKASIVARSLRGVNGLCLDREERWLYGALTAEGRIRRWRRQPDGTLTDPEDYGPVLGKVVPNHMVADIRALSANERVDLGYCDGTAFDMDGNLWITLPFSNKIVAITPSGKLVEIIHDPEGQRISMPTNLCWGGADRRDLYVVSRGNSTIVKARTKAVGLPLANWPTA